MSADAGLLVRFGPAGFLTWPREMTEPPTARIYYCYGEFQPMFNNCPPVHFHEGLPELSDEVIDGRELTLLVVDDLMAETNQLVANIFTKISHHRNISVLHLTQNLFDFRVLPGSTSYGR